MTTSSYAADGIKETKRQYIIMVGGSYFMTGFFWAFHSLGSSKLNTEDPAEPFFLSLIILMLSNGLWEILTGWYADKFKRRFSISAGFFACFLGFLIMGLAAFIPFNDATHSPNLQQPRILVWLTGVTLWSLGPALLSGAREAWLVDRCNFLSVAPPEPLDDIFKRTARMGVIAKALGSLICFFTIFWLIVDNDSSNGPKNLELAFSICAGPAAILSFGLFAYSLRLKEEYWTDPKYQTNESLLSFLWMGIKDLWKAPYRWFTLAFIGATTLNYALSSTVWGYLGKATTIQVLNRPLSVATIAGAFIGIELVAGYISKAFSKGIDKIKAPQWRMPVASVMYLLPLLPLFLPPGMMILPLVLFAVTFMYRTAHASVFGTLYTVGQSAIESDERRAILVSLSSALAAFFTAILFMVVSCYDFPELGRGIRFFWKYMMILPIVLLAVGGYLVARGRNQQ